MKGTCRFCGCTDAQACEGGCSWADEEETTCSRCAIAVELATFALPLFVSLAAKVKTKSGVAWADLADVDRQLLVMALRALQEGMERGLREDIGLDEDTAARDLRELAQHLIEKFPEERDRIIAGDESIVDATIRLLNKVKPSGVLITG